MIPRRKRLSRWNPNNPGDNPVCIIGAGFQRAVLDPCLPSTDDIIPNTVAKFPNRFPALTLLTPLLMKPHLDYVWTNIYRICQYGASLTPKVIAAYKKTTFAGTPMGYLVEHLKNQPAASSPSWLLCVILGVELKRMLALQYDHKNLKLKDSMPGGLVKFLDETLTRAVTWISLNYDLSLESVMRKHSGCEKWRYAFEGLFQTQNKRSPRNVRHLIAKPHGSLNIWFNTVWESRSSSGKRDRHQLSFVDATDRLKTCPFAEVGCINGNDPLEERRPWVIGYLPDAMKDEHNSPGNFADTAHDLCKWNLAYAGLAFQGASSLYVLGYSMPDEDRWIWERLAALRKKDLPIYVASRGASQRIKAAFEAYGFSKTEILTSDGSI